MPRAATDIPSFLRTTGYAKNGLFGRKRFFTQKKEHHFAQPICAISPMHQLSLLRPVPSAKPG